MSDTVFSPVNLQQRWINMQEYSHTNAAVKAIRLNERRQNIRKRNIVEHGVLMAEISLISGVEYLQSHGIEADIIKRVLLELLSRRLSSRQIGQSNSHQMQD